MMPRLVKKKPPGFYYPHNVPDGYEIYDGNKFVKGAIWMNRITESDWDYVPETWTEIGLGNFPQMNIAIPRMPPKACAECNDAGWVFARINPRENAIRHCPTCQPKCPEFMHAPNTNPAKEYTMIDCLKGLKKMEQEAKATIDAIDKIHQCDRRIEALNAEREKHIKALGIARPDSQKCETPKAKYNLDFKIGEAYTIEDLIKNAKSIRVESVRQDSTSAGRFDTYVRMVVCV